MFNLSMSGKMAGSGKLSVRRGDGAVEEYADNNQLLASFFTKANTGTTFSITPRLKIGTGTVANDVNTSQLGAVLAPVSGTWPTATLLEDPLGTLVEAGTKIRAYIKYQFAASVGAFIGNISEYGLNLSNDGSTTSGVVDTRVLITDIDGNPTTITLGALDQLMCEYTFEVLLPYTDVVTTVSGLQDGVATDYTVTMRPAILAKFVAYMNLSNANSGASQVLMLTDSPIGDIGTALPVATVPAQGDNGAAAALVGDGTKRKFAATIPTTNGNLPGGITGATVGNRANWFKMGFNPPLPKASNNTIRFDINLTHSQ